MPFKPQKQTILFLFSVAILFVPLIGCSPRLSNTALPIENVSDFSNSGYTGLQDKWWLSFEDENLNILIDSAMQSNLDLAAIWHQFLAANAIISREAAVKWPQIEGSAQTAYNRPEPDFAGGENTQLGLSARYEVDLWGRVKTAVQAEKYRAEASFLDYQTAAISLSAEIAATWYQLLAAKKQLNIAEEQIDTNKDIIKVIRSRFVGGQIKAVDLLRQAQLLENTKEQQIIFSTTVRLLENQLAVLIGRQPQNNMEFETGDLPVLPELPDTGLPLELVRRRPDIQQAYSLVLAADRDMASAIQSKYPRIAISGRGQLRSNNFANLFENWAYSVVGNILAPIFYGGQISAEVDRNEAIKQQRLYEYGQVTLIAFREVEDGIIQETMQKQRLETISRQLELAQNSNKQLQVEFLNGLSPYLDVLLGLDQEQQLRRDYVAAQLQQIQIRIALYRALAGGFETGRTITQ